MKKIIICDWNRTLFNPLTKNIYFDTKYFLSVIKAYTLILISTNEINNDKYIKIVSKCFNKIIIGKKDANIFKKFKKFTSNKNIWVIGDKLDSEIYFGNLCNFQTIQLKRGKFKNELPKNKAQQPKFIVNSLRQALKIILSK